MALSGTSALSSGRLSNRQGGEGCTKGHRNYRQKTENMARVMMVGSQINCSA